MFVFVLSNPLFPPSKMEYIFVINSIAKSGSI